VSGEEVQWVRSNNYGAVLIGVYLVDCFMMIPPRYPRTAGIQDVLHISFNRARLDAVSM